MGLLSFVPSAKMALISSAVAFVAGGAAMTIYEHNVPWGLAKRLDKMEKDLPGKLAEASNNGARAQFDQDKKIVEDQWRPALQRCEDARKQDSAKAGAKIDAALAQQSASRTAAYRLGQASCGASNATLPKSTTPGAGGSPVAGSLPDDTDLGSILGAAAYAPGAKGGRPSGG